MLVRSCLISCILGFSIMWTKNFQMSKMGLEKEEKLEIKLPTFAGLYRKQGNFRKKKSISVSSAMLKPLTVYIMRNYRKFLQSWAYQAILPASWETCMQVKKQQLEPCVEELIDSRLRKKDDRDASSHPVCLTYMLNTSWEMPDEMRYRPE